MKLIGGYTEEMRKSIDKVNKTRSKRMNEVFPHMTMEERDKVLKENHPDYKTDVKRALLYGENKGDIIPDEVANILESYPIINPDDIDLSKIDYDVGVLIIGAGGAGTAAAIWAHHSGVPADDILVSSKLRHGDANTVMAQGGIQIADRPEDSPLIHYLDAVGGGHFDNIPELAKALVGDAPAILKWHKDLGVMYDLDENGNFMVLSGGGTSRSRMHSA
ncbi:MAG: FAD-binding protein, partial [Candidatus Heimdallarchaeota archaeon]|nr:FAD-binding protein [Candidatus Heimdallarchaeota archaeon]MCK4878371.1 FAD-binding protein [Candidatus Heimdallarchaeota archaeon]